MKLLELLEGVREVSPGQYVAQCPAHDDRSPSLSIKDCDDGRVLVHCFAGCEIENVLSSVGLTFADVMPAPVMGKHRFSPDRSRVLPGVALATLDHESFVIEIIVNDILAHKEIDEPTWERLVQAADRIHETRAASVPARVSR